MLRRARRSLLALPIAALAAAAVAAPAATASEFTAGGYEAFTFGLQDETIVFHTNGGEAVCSTAELEGTMDQASSTLGLHPVFSGCKAFGFLSATVETTGCGFTYHAGDEVSTGLWEGTLDVFCAGGSTITITAATCQVKIEAQSGLDGPQFANLGSGVLAIGQYVPDVVYNITNNGLLCPLSGTGNTSDGEYTGTAQVTALDEFDDPVGLEIG